MTEQELLSKALDGTAGAFDRLVASHVVALEALIRRLVLHPQDAEDLAQETLLTAHKKLNTFRGEASFRTWLLSIGTRKALDHLRARKRWPPDAQSTAASAHYHTPALLQDMGRAVEPEDFVYDYREHVAYCFSCIGRSLDPEEAAAILLREVFEFTNAEAAHALGLSHSAFRHRLAHAREFMTETFEGTCALIGKQGACWQCQGLRDNLPEDKRGVPVAAISEDSYRDVRFRRRLEVVRDARFGEPTATSRSLHDYITRYMARRYDGSAAQRHSSDSD